MFPGGFPRGRCYDFRCYCAFVVYKCNFAKLCWQIHILSRHSYLCVSHCEHADFPRFVWTTLIQGEYTRAAIEAVETGDFSFLIFLIFIFLSLVRRGDDRQFYALYFPSTLWDVSPTVTACCPTAEPQNVAAVSRPKLIYYRKRQRPDK